MKYVYQLQGRGVDWLTSSFTRTIINTVVFATYEQAESMREKFKLACIKGHRLEFPVTVDIIKLEVINE